MAASARWHRTRVAARDRRTPPVRLARRRGAAAGVTMSAPTDRSVPSPVARAGAWIRGTRAKGSSAGSRGPGGGRSARRGGPRPIGASTVEDEALDLRACSMPGALPPGGSFTCVVDPVPARVGGHVSGASVRASGAGRVVTAEAHAYYRGVAVAEPDRPPPSPPSGPDPTPPGGEDPIPGGPENEAGSGARALRPGTARPPRRPPRCGRQRPGPTDTSRPGIRLTGGASDGHRRWTPRSRRKAVTRSKPSACPASR
jgi:hypothetical protein